jgi:hypothetical protein
VAQAEGDPKVNAEVLKRLHEMQKFLNTTTHWYDQMLGVPKAQLMRLMGMGDTVFKLLKLTGRKAK